VKLNTCLEDWICLCVSLTAIKFVNIQSEFNAGSGVMTITIIFWSASTDANCPHERTEIKDIPMDRMLDGSFSPKRISKSLSYSFYTWRVPTPNTHFLHYYMFPEISQTCNGNYSPFMPIAQNLILINSQKLQFIVCWENCLTFCSAAPASGYRLVSIQVLNP